MKKNGNVYGVKKSSCRKALKSKEKIVNNVNAASAANTGFNSISNKITDGLNNVVGIDNYEENMQDRINGKLPHGLRKLSEVLKYMLSNNYNRCTNNEY